MVSTFPLSDKNSTEIYLTQNSIEFHVSLIKLSNLLFLQTVNHVPVANIPAMLETVKFEGVYADTKFAKNLFLYDKKKKERLWLVICAHDTAFSMKALEKSFGIKNGDLRGADPEILESTLGVKGGSVNLFAIINDKDNKVKLVIDHTLLNNFEYVGFHPMQNDYTTAIKRESVQKIIDLSHHEA